MSLDNIQRAIEISIAQMELVREMTKLLTFADTKDDFVYILKRMDDELQEGIDEIDQMLSQNMEEMQ
jgi:hypothetical protein